jgi:hypothetical protein
MNKIRTRLLELYLIELRGRERLTGTDRITLYREFREVLEERERTENDTGPAKNSNLDDHSPSPDNNTSGHSTRVGFWPDVCNIYSPVR